MKLTIFDLTFDIEGYYIERESIVEKITVNTRTLYSRFEAINGIPSEELIKQHLRGEVVLALPLVNNDCVPYIVLEYEREESNRYYHLIKHLLKSIGIETFYTYQSSRANHVQIFIPRLNLPLQQAYTEVEKIKHLLELKSTKRCKFYPDKNLPKNYNKITLPLKKM